MENNVKVKKTKDGNVVTPFAGNSDYGFVILNSVENVFQNGWLQSKERTTLIRGEVSMLSMAFSATTSLPGRIAVTECDENNIPQRFVQQFNKDNGFEENIAPFIKRAGEDGPVLMNGDKRILRFTEYSADGQQADVRVPHTNGDEVLAFNQAKTTGKAKL